MMQKPLNSIVQEFAVYWELTGYAWIIFMSIDETFTVYH